MKRETFRWIQLTDTNDLVIPHAEPDYNSLPNLKIADTLLTMSIRKSVSVTSLSAYMDHIDSLYFHEEVVLFRGQDCRRNLVPGIWRNNEKFSIAAEKRMFNEFKLQAAAYLGGGMTDMDTLIVAQHHGLKTRLLDWSGNALAAMWFACQAPGDKSRYVYMLGADEMVEDDYSAVNPFKPGRTVVIQPSAANARVRAQTGWFTVHNYSKKQFLPLESNSRISGKITEVVIPPSSRQSIVDQLDRAGVNAWSVFPDLDGLCKRLNWAHIQRSIAA